MSFSFGCGVFLQLNEALIFELHDILELLQLLLDPQVELLVLFQERIALEERILDHLELLGEVLGVLNDQIFVQVEVVETALHFSPKVV